MAKKKPTKAQIREIQLLEVGYRFAKKNRNKATKWERIINKMLKDLNENFKFQYPVVFRSKTLYVIDFYFPDRNNLILEIDGKSTHGTPEKIKADKIRTRNLKKLGFHVRRLWNSQVERLKNKEELLQILNIPVK